MKNLLLFIVKYGPFFLFMTLQALCFYLIVEYNQKQKSIFLNSSNLFSGYLNEKNTNLKDFFNLQKENLQLAKENAKLLQAIINEDNYRKRYKSDTINNLYIIREAEICSKSLNKGHNTLTLCAGSKDGIKPGMGLIGYKGIVGIVTDVSSSYAQVIPLNNVTTRISGLLSKDNFFGDIIWESSDPKTVQLKTIPRRANVSIGDTVITSGYSTIFPKNLLIGKVKEFGLESDGANYDIDVEIAEDVYNLKHVFVIESLLQKEFIEQISIDE